MLTWCAQQSKTYCADRLKIMRAGLVSISSVAGGWVFTPHPCVYAGHSSSDPKESFARREIMRAGEEHRQLGANIFVANACFKRDVLVIPSSDHNAELEEHSSGVRLASSVSAELTFFRLEAEARRVIMRPGREQARLGSKLFVARRVQT